MKLSDTDYRLIVSVFQNCTETERNWIFDENHIDFYKNVDLREEYDLTMNQKEYAVDAWRAVIFFLKMKGFKLLDEEGNVDGLDWIDKEFIEA